MSPAADAPRLDRAETYAETVHRIYGDRRATPPARELLLAVAYALFVAPGEPVAGRRSRNHPLHGRTGAGAEPRKDDRRDSVVSAPTAGGNSPWL
ncbi:hypothetical protein [Streptomyces sp. NPDC051000]|uniref:hypothetical protein n=1 Tax=Streptomyces sp. NPDC051000 TaxID=3155520 RepID=UPI00340D7303